MNRQKWSPANMEERLRGSFLIKALRFLYKKLKALFMGKTAYLESLFENRMNRINREIKNLDCIVNHQCFLSQLVPVFKGEKIRMVFLFQVASFWPSWESFYQTCKKDERIECLFVLLDETVKEEAQMLTAKKFLDDNKIDYVIYNNSTLDDFNPHVLIMQTPYDKGHRRPHSWSGTINQKGIRIVYIPYGIEIADTESARFAHFRQDVILNSWRIYTFSPRMLEDYITYSPNGLSARCLGIPKFDSFFYKENFPLRADIIEEVKARKIVLWKAHFPKLIEQDGKTVMVTPPIEEYLAFLDYIKQNPDLFFIFMPHPRFCLNNGNLLTQSKASWLVKQLEQTENAYVEWADDYRPSLFNADYIISDRSAVMVEAGAVGVPVLYLYNADYSEPLTAAIQPLIESYYGGKNCSDMIHFVDMCKREEDPKKEVRKAAFRKCIPYFDGQCGKRIKEDIIGSLMAERSVNISEWMYKLENQMNEINHKLDLLCENVIKVKD